MLKDLINCWQICQDFIFFRLKTFEQKYNLNKCSSFCDSVYLCVCASVVSVQQSGMVLGGITFKISCKY